MAEADHGPAWSFEKQLFWTTLVIAVALVPALGLALRSLQMANGAQRQLARTFVRKISLVQELRSAEALQNTLVPVFVLTGEPELLDGLKRARTAFDANVAALRAMPLPQSEAAKLEQIVAQQAKLVAEQAPGFALRQAGRPISEVDAFFREHAVALVRVVNDAIADLLNDTRRAYELREADNEGAVRNAFYVLTVSLVLAVASMLVAVKFLFRTVLNKKAADLEKEQAAERVGAIAQARKEAVEVVAHDLKNPLSAVMLLAEQMGRRTSDDRSTRMLDGISSAAESMRLLISNLLDHAKIEAGPLALSVAADDVVPLMCILVARYEVLAARNGVRVTNVLPSTLPSVAFDAVKLEQTFANLLGNAVKFTPSGGTVTLSGSADARHVRLAVSDTGRGMAADQLANVFERYWQAGETASWGTGLGLAIAKAVVIAHGGTIAVDSAQGKGSTFTVALPRVDLDEVADGVAA